MAVSGHRTCAVFVFDRYNIVSDADLGDARQDAEHGQNRDKASNQATRRDGSRRRKTRAWPGGYGG